MDFPRDQECMYTYGSVYFLFSWITNNIVKHDFTKNLSFCCLTPSIFLSNYNCESRGYICKSSRKTANQADTKTKTTSTGVTNAQVV